VLPEYLLGIVLTLPGYKTVIVTPLIGHLGLPEASGRAPTPSRPVEAAWAVDDTSIDPTIVMPAGITASLQLPSSATVDGNKSQIGQLEVTCGTTQLKLNLV
jgi:hypothetical protein